jgi:hypothetical protein
MEALRASLGLFIDTGVIESGKIHITSMFRTRHRILGLARLYRARMTPVALKITVLSKLR